MAACRQPAEVLLPLGRVMAHDLMGYPVEGEPLQHTRQAQAVVTVEVRDADMRDFAGLDPGQQHLTLGSLAGVEQQPGAVPPQQIAIVVAVPGGRLACGAQHHQLTVRHGGLPYEAHGRGSAGAGGTSRSGSCHQPTSRQQPSL